MPQMHSPITKGISRITVISRRPIRSMASSTHRPPHANDANDAPKRPRPTAAGHPAAEPLPLAGLDLVHVEQRRLLVDAPNAAAAARRTGCAIEPRRLQLRR